VYLLGAHEGRGLDEGGGVLLGLGAVSIAGGIRRPRQVMTGWQKPEEESWEVARLLKRQRPLGWTPNTESASKVSPFCSRRRLLIKQKNSRSPWKKTKARESGSNRHIIDSVILKIKWSERPSVGQEAHTRTPIPSTFATTPYPLEECRGPKQRLPGPQSSGHPPVLMLSSVHFWTCLGGGRAGKAGGRNHVMVVIKR